MSRSLPEWIGRSDDAKIPPRVMERVARKVDGRCVVCTRETGPALPGECDHIVPLILGGEHRERNLQWLCKPCHAAKSRLDVKLKAKAARISQRNLGIKRKPSRSWGYGKDDKFKMKIGGGIVPR
jgi:5-methylcytosine-specific restriction endonuclease McrA